MTSRNNAPGLSLLPRGNSASYRVPLSPSPKEKYPFVSSQRWKLSRFSLFLKRLCRASGSRPRASLSYPVSRCATFSSILWPFSSNNSHLCTTLYTVESIIITSGLKVFSFEFNARGEEFANQEIERLKVETEISFYFNSLMYSVIR